MAIIATTRPGRLHTYVYDFVHDILQVFHCKGLMNGAPLQSGYDCHTSPDGKELIIFDTACILPCYIVHYGPSQGVFKYA